MGKAHAWCAIAVPEFINWLASRQAPTVQLAT